ncbi:MAG: isochorismatase family protein [Lentisphaeria bacterium]|nr:isochorismatase family protein [Lentisphaeria bacterium]
MKLTTSDTFTCVVDLQEKLVPAMGNSENLMKRVKILLGGLQSLEIPVLATEQYPKGLGATLPEVSELFTPGAAVIEKNSFSCFGTESFAEAARQCGRKNMILLGVESHVCVFQTALDALELGYTVYLVEDCIDSRFASDKAAAIAALRDAGVKILTSEMILFMLMRASSHPAFKTISKLIR